MDITNNCYDIGSSSVTSNVATERLIPQGVLNTRTVSIDSSSSTTTIAPGLELLSSLLFDMEDTRNDVEVSNGDTRYQEHPTSHSTYTTLPIPVTPKAKMKSKILPSDTTTSTSSSSSSTKARKDRTYIEDDVREDDILCGRGGRSNNHPGNKRYRRVVDEFRMLYQQSEAKNIKTELNHTIVEHCYSYGARFLKTDGISGRYYNLTKSEARKKTSQALRETKGIKIG